MKKVFSHIGYCLGFGFWYLISLLPLRIFYIISDFLYLLVRYVVKYRHKIIWKNLKESFPEKTEKELTEIEKGFYHYFCDYVVETIKLMTMSKKQLRRRMVFKGTEEIERATSQGKSCGVFLGHYCNWEWITSLPYWIPDNSLCCEFYHPLENDTFDTLFKYVRERNGALCIPMQDSVRTMYQFKQQGKPLVVGYISDQVPMWKNIHHWLNFLNHDTPVLTGTERIMKHSEQVVFYADVHKEKRGHYVCEFHLITDDASSVGDYGLTDIYFRELEKTIRREPSLYLWSHNRWKRTREEFNRRYNVVNGKVIPRKEG